MFKIIHVSDLHLREGWHEEQGVLLKVFIDDLAGRKINRNTDLFVFSGDLVQAGSSAECIAEFTQAFGAELDKHFLPKNRLFCPGNHDIDRDYVEKYLSVLQPIAEKLDAETPFNTNISEPALRNLVRPKFSNIFGLAPKLFGTSLTLDSFPGKGFSVTPHCSVYILNTALYSFGGVKDSNGHPICDKQKLRIETRNLRDWLASDTAPFRILIAHHPADWLVGWAQNELEIIGRKHFDLLLYGHEHAPDTFSRSRQ